MPPPQSAAELKNLALLAIYAKPLTNFDNTDSPTAISVNLLYDQCRQELLRMHCWNFARRRVALNLDPTVTPLFDYEGAYQLPSDLLHLHHIGTEYDQWDNRVKHDIQGRHIYYEDAPETLYIEYTVDVTDVSQMDALFKKAFRYYLASELCMPVTGNIKVALEVEKKYERAMKAAGAINAQERPMRVIDRDPIQEARANWDESAPQVIVPDDAWPS